MTTLKRIALGFGLVLALAVSAMAGETNAPPCSPNPGETNTPPCSSSPMVNNDDSFGIQEITEDIVDTTVFAIDSLLSIL